MMDRQTNKWSVDEYQEVGTQNYHEKKYLQALKAFTAAIDLAVVPSMDLLDQRAATYGKLLEFNHAVRDARDMVRMDKKDAKGYLRMGRLLESQDKLEKALEIYRLGVNHVPITHKSFESLKQQRDKLIRQLSPPSANDPFSVLPRELAQQVLCYLTFRDIVNCLRVSKAWKNYLIQHPHLWTDLDLAVARKDVKRAFVQNVVRYSQYRIHRAIIHRFKHPDVIRNLVTACKGLTHLEIISGDFGFDSLVEIVQCAPNLKVLIIHFGITMDTASQILRRRPTLERVEFRRLIGNAATSFQGPFPCLHTFIAAHDKKTSDSPNLDSLLPQAPKLRNLILAHFTPLSTPMVPNFSNISLTRLELANYDFRRRVFPLLPSTLIHLSLRPAVRLSFPLLPVDPIIMLSWHNLRSSHLPKLTHLSISNFTDLTPDFFTALLQTRIIDNVEDVPCDRSTLSPLRHLSIRDCEPDDFENPVFFGLTAPDGLIRSDRILSPSLLSLDLFGFPVTDEDIQRLLANHISSLRTLNLTGTRVSGAGVKLLVDQVPTLRDLNLDYCRCISDPDILVYARKKGIKVSYQMD